MKNIKVNLSCDTIDKFLFFINFNADNFVIFKDVERKKIYSVLTEAA